MKKSKERTWISIWLLLAIIGSNFYIIVGSMSISVTFLLLCLGAFILSVQSSRLFMHIFASLTVSIGYASILIWEMISPVWVIFNRDFLVTLLLLILIAVMTTNRYKRISVCLTGMLCGEWMFRLTLISYDLNQVIGAMAFFDQLALTVFGIVSLDGIKMILSHLARVFKRRPAGSIEWQKQKTYL